MSESGVGQDGLPEVTLRIPGDWDGPAALAEALPEGVEIGEEQRLVLPHGGSVEINALPADDEFLQVFASGCTREPTDEEKRGVENYAVNVCLTGPGGSFEAAERMVEAGAAILRAGGYGVFVDNSGIAHGRQDWLDLTGGIEHRRAQDGGEALNENDDGEAFWAFVMIYGDEQNVWSRGMQVMGCRDGVLPRSGDDEFDHFYLRNFLSYTYRSPKPVVDGDVMVDLVGEDPVPRFVARQAPDAYVPAESAMHNPYGLWRLEPIEDPIDPEAN